MEGHGPSWPRKTAPNGGPCSVMAASSSTALRDKPQGPKNGRDGARPSRKRARSRNGGPRSLVAAKDGTKWRAMLCHGRLFFGRLTGQTAKPQKRTRRSASLQRKTQVEGHGPSWPRKTAPNGGPCSVMAASSSAALRDKPQSPRNGRDGARPSTENPMEGHGPSWPRAEPPRPKNGRDGARPSKGKPRWRATVPRGRERRHQMEGHGPSWPRAEPPRPKNGRDGARPSKDGREGQTADKAGPDSPRVRLQNRCRDPVRWSLGADSSSLAASCLKLRLDAASG